MRLRLSRGTGPEFIAANVVVFVSSFCVMVLELIAARILAPHIGVSLYTWTSIIGTILAAIALGNFLGGKIADAFKSPLVLAAVFLAGGIAAMGILPATRVVTSADWFGSFTPMLNFTLKTCCIFFLPAMVLSMVSPVAIKLALADLKKTGGVVGTVYAVSTAGAILGTFMTGFFFIAWFGLRMVVWVVAGVLVVAGIGIGLWWKTPHRGQRSFGTSLFWILAAIALLTGVLLFSFRERWQENYTRESNYYSIRVRTLEGNIKMLSLDNVVHSYVVPDEPATLIFPTLKAFAEIVHYMYAKDSKIKVLHLGGGGYSFPRYLDVEYPNAVNEVVEIDPAVTEVAYAELGLPTDSAIRSYNLDARQFLIQRSRGPGYEYDIVVSDILYGLSIPYHLVTFEFNRLVKENMEPGGVYLVNIIDDYARGRFMASVIWTLKHVFNNVYLLSMQPNWDYPGFASYVVAATDSKIDLEGLRRYSSGGVGSAVANAHDPARLDEYLAGRNAVLLTDDYAPTDILLAKRRR